MNKTLNINLAGLIFHIDEEAYLKLESYLRKLKEQFRNSEGGHEIISDIESRIAELLKEKISLSKEVISMDDINEVINILGRPEDYLDDEEQEQKATEPNYTYSRTEKRIFRDRDDRVLAGVASGLAAYFNIETIWVRLIWVIALFSGFGFLIYIILWIVIPEARTTAEKLQMKGAKVNIDNIEKSIKSGVETMNKNVKDFSQKARDFDYSGQAQKINTTAGSIGRSTGNVAKNLVRFIAKLIGFLFLIIGIMLLISFTVALLTGGFALAGLGYGFEDIMAFASLIADSAGQARSILFGASILALMPLIILIYLGLKLIFGLEPMNVWLKRTIAIFSLIGLIIIISNLVSVKRSFNSRSYVKTTETISLDSTFTLYGIQDDIWEMYEDGGFEQKWIYINGKHTFNNIRLNIKLSTDSLVWLETKAISQGGNRRDARKNAQNIKHQFLLKGSEFTLSPYTELAPNAKFRGQELNYTLYLPENFVVNLDPSSVDVFYDLDNVDGYHDYDMVRHSWIMTSKGLKCVDCFN